MRVSLEDGLLHTDVYSKPTDAHQYLNYKSCHPPHVKRGIPYGQALRFKRICDSDEVFERRLDDLRGFLVNRGYEKDFIENQFNRAREVDRFNLFDRGEKNKQSNGVNLVIDYHPALRGLYGIFKELQSVSSYIPLGWREIHAIRGFPRNSWILRYSPARVPRGIARVPRGIEGCNPSLNRNTLPPGAT